MSADKINIIIPCYWVTPELVDMTSQCLQSLGEKDGVLVVDDGSPLEYPSDIRLPENQGYAAAVNAGLDGADGDYLVICNNDIIFIQPDWLDHLLKPLKESAGISTIRTTEPDGWQTEDRYEENAHFGSLWAMTRETYEALGPLDERFGKGYGEDMDYWHRARNAGIRIVKNHNGLAEHVGKATFKITDPQDTAFFKCAFTYKQKWGDEAGIYLTAPNTIMFFNKWEVQDMPQKQKDEYLHHELSLEDVEKRWGKQW